MRSRTRFAAGLMLALLYGCGRSDEQAVKGVDTTLPENPAVLTGTVSFPSDYIPADLRICAEAVQGGASYCNAKIDDRSYTLEVPAGSYRVFAQTADDPGVKAYFSRFVECGSYISCESHDPIIVTVQEGEKRGGVDPGDWYVPDSSGRSAASSEDAEENYEPESEGDAPEDAAPEARTEQTAAEMPARSLVGPLHALFSSDDYPASALENEEQGTVGYRLTIGPSGRVYGCSITVSSGSAALDRATCNILRMRARFTEPASGTESSEGRIHWRLQ